MAHGRYFITKIFYKAQLEYRGSNQMGKMETDKSNFGGKTRETVRAVTLSGPSQAVESDRK